MFLEQLFCWFTSYLEGTQTVKAGNVISAPGLLLYRVPHGSVLGSSLFSVYTVPVLAIAVGRGIVVINLQMTRNRSSKIHSGAEESGRCAELTCCLRCARLLTCLLRTG